MLQMSHVYKYYNQMPALLDVNLRIFKGDMAFITGASGAGKSTLLKLLYLGERCTKGQILIAGRNVERLTPAQIPVARRIIGVVFQDFKLIPYKSVYANIAISLEVIGLPKAVIEQKILALLKKLGLYHKRHELPAALSGGEQQRVAIARALVNDPMILLADEPTGNLDTDLTTEIFQIFREANNRGTTVIVATHDKKLLGKFAKNALHLEKGRVFT